MEEEDDLVVVIVDNEINDTYPYQIIPIKQEIEETKPDLAVEDIIERAERHGQFIKLEEPDEYNSEYLEDEGIHEGIEETKPNLAVEDIIERAEKHGQFIKLEEPDEYNSEYLEDEVISQEKYKVEVDIIGIRESDDDDNTSLQSEDHPLCEAFLTEKSVNKKRTVIRSKKILTSKEQRSIVEELREENPYLRDDKKLLINTLCTIMLNQKPPTLPENCYRDYEGRFICTICDAVKVTEPAVQRHYYEKHGPRYLMCFACGDDFRSKTNLYKHEKHCKAPDAKLVLQARAFCLGGKARNRPYINVKNNKPQKNRRVKFGCSSCSAVFSLKTALLAHESMHRGERPFQCHICPAAYTSALTLDRHLKTHSGSKYVCDHCGRKYTRRGGLIVHMETHKPESSKYSCKFCGRRFAQRASQKRHEETVHLQLPPPFACEICPKRFRRMYTLQDHMKTEHGCQIVTKHMFFRMLPMMAENELKQVAKVVLNNETT